MVRGMEATLDTTEQLGINSVNQVEDPIPYLPWLQQKLITHREMLAPFYNVQDIIDWTREGAFHLWVGKDADDNLEMMALTEVLTSKRAKAVSVVLCVGSNVEAYFPKFFHGLELYAKLLEADVITIEGREAWKKLLKPLDFHLYKVCLMRKL